MFITEVWLHAIKVTFLHILKFFGGIKLLAPPGMAELILVFQCPDPRLGNLKGLGTLAFICYLW